MSEETGKRVLVVGASGGIGGAVSNRLAALGWEVVRHGRRFDEDRDDGQGEVLTGDVVEWAKDPKTIPEVGPVDAVVWSSGICELMPGHWMKAGALESILRVNLVAPLVVSSWWYRKRVIRDGGSLILIGSSSAEAAGEGFAAYAASKGGLASAARVLGKEFARRKVAVRCLAPRTVDTPMTQRLAATFAGLGEKDGAAMLTPEAVAGEVAALLEGA